MKKKHVAVILAALLLAQPAMAQKRKTAAKKKAVATEEPVGDPKFEQMLAATQQVMFVDSIVTDKQDFLNCYRLSTEAGTISSYNQFFATDSQPYSVVYANQFGNKCWFASNGRLYTADKLDGKWSEPAPLEGLGHFQRANYPFMQADGLTLCFAAISDEGLGGLDIYISRYDSESGKFLLAENLGLPFNSEANDYMYAVDEFNGVGYFATDRRQPEGKVCIYTFVPNQKRIVYSADEYDVETVRSRARIDRIADTWTDPSKRDEALRRLQNPATAARKDNQRQEPLFIINDDIAYTRLSDFKVNENRERLKRLNGMRKNYERLDSEIEKMRMYYATKASGDEKRSLQTEIQGYEQEYRQLKADISQLEKTIRNTELQTVP